MTKLKLILLGVTMIGVSACASLAGNSKDDPTSQTGAVSSDQGTNASGAMNGFAAANGDPVANTGNLSSSTAAGDPMNGVNRADGPLLPY